MLTPVYFYVPAVERYHSLEFYQSVKNFHKYLICIRKNMIILVKKSPWARPKGSGRIMVNGAHKILFRIQRYTRMT
ncbi:hypothetical protein DY251_08300 [Mesorhizobium denitrificans]|uniref:Uncharacterized protein n=1 Tax=Mesorhizobium denitrificans TaxID=2294114 RepID=A0A371XG93_9HYPH|nr:hypothetical protein DY251_08300 [Mesorhizobium denitrificans]